MKLLGWVLALAALNLGLSALGINLVESVLGGSDSLLVKVVYLAVGAAGAFKLYLLVSKKK